MEKYFVMTEFDSPEIILFNKEEAFSEKYFGFSYIDSFDENGTHIHTYYMNTELNRWVEI